MAPSLTGALAVANGNLTNLQVIALAGDGLPYLIWQDYGSGRWSFFGVLPHGNVPGGFSNVAAVRGNGGNLQVILLGFDSNLYLIWQDNRTGSWNWYGKLAPVEGFLNITAGRRANGDVQVVAFGGDGVPYLVTQNNLTGQWDFGGALPHDSSIALLQGAMVLGSSNNQQVIAIGRDDAQPYLIWQDSGSGKWSWYGALPWHPFSPTGIVYLAVGRGNGGNVQVLAKGLDEGLYLVWQDAGDGRWNFYGSLEDGLRITGLATGIGKHSDLQVIASANDAMAYRFSQDDSTGTWTFDGTLPYKGGELISGLAACVGSGQNLQVILIGHSDSIPYLVWQDQASGNWNWYGALPTS